MAYAANDVGRRSVVVFAFLAPLLLRAVPVDAEGWNPSATVSAYIAAFNMGNVDGALALFDENGSATDLTGRTYSGRAGLTQFLRNNGFGSANARLTTDQLTVVANRAFWDYTCSCATVPTQARIVINDQDKMTIPLALAFFNSVHGQRYDLTLTAATLVVIPVVLVFLLLQRQFVQGIALTGLKA